MFFETSQYKNNPDILNQFLLYYFCLKTSGDIGKSVRMYYKYEDNEYNINITMIVNETTYWFTVNFDVVANDIIDFQYQIGND